MNILYTNFHRGYGGGHTTYIKNLILNSTFKVHVACPKHSQLYEAMLAENIVLVDLLFPSKFKDFLDICRSVITLVRLLDAWQIDLVHTNENADNRIVFLASLFTRRKFKVVLTKHNDKPIKKCFTSRWRFEKFNSAVIYVCSSIQDTIGLVPRGISPLIIPNGIDTKKWQQSILAVHKPIHLVSIAGTAKCKGIQHLLGALKLLSVEQQKKFTITIVGEYPSVKYLKELALHGLEFTPVKFVGYTPQPQKYLLAADLGFVLSDSEETISFACREMMSCGLPVIVSDFGGLPDNVDHGINGWITKRSDSGSIAATLREILLFSGPEILGFKHAARLKAVKEFDLSNMQQQTYMLYDSLFKQS